MQLGRREEERKRPNLLLTVALPGPLCSIFLQEARGEQGRGAPDFLAFHADETKTNTTNYNLLGIRDKTNMTYKLGWREYFICRCIIQSQEKHFLVKKPSVYACKKMYPTCLRPVCCPSRCMKLIILF